MSVMQLTCKECGYNNWQLIYGESTKLVFAVCEECGAEIKVDDLKSSHTEAVPS